MTLRRILLLLSALILVFSAVMHTRAFERTASAVASSNLPLFFGGSLKALWLIDSTVLSTVAAIIALSAWRPSTTSKLALLLVAAIPTATAGFLYCFLGAFPPAHLLLGAGLFAAVAAVITPVVKHPQRDA